MSDDQTWEEAAGILRGYMAATLGPLASARYSPLRSVRYIGEAAERAAAEERDRRQWLDGVKRRLGLVVAGEVPPPAVEWPAGIPDGPWETVSSHTLELPAGWPPGCRCVLSDGVRVSLGGPCPALHWHYGPTATDPDPGKMWCEDCGGEVSALEGIYVCSCGRQAE